MKILLRTQDPFASLWIACGPGVSPKIGPGLTYGPRNGPRAKNFGIFFHEHPDRYADFADRYEKELEFRKQEIRKTILSFHPKKVVFLYASANLRENNAVILRDVLTRWQGQEKTRPADS